jgi:hypothetical protein
MKVSLVTGIYRIIQVNIGEVFATSYFQGRLSDIRDGSNKYES